MIDIVKVSIFSIKKTKILSEMLNILVLIFIRKSWDYKYTNDLSLQRIVRHKKSQWTMKLHEL